MKSAVFDKPDTEPRKAPNKDAFISMLIRQGTCPGFQFNGVTRQCGIRLSAARQVEYDHKQSLGLSGDNSPENFVALCGECHQVKTDMEKTVRAKADRQAGRKGQFARRKERGRSSIQSRNELGKKPPGYKHRWPKGRWS